MRPNAQLRCWAFLLAVLAWAASSSAAQAQDVWFAPQARLTGDYMSLFQQDAPWPVAAAHTKVFEVGGRFLVDAPDYDLRNIFADIKRRHIQLAIGFEPLSGRGRGPGACGYHIEGYGGPIDGGRALARRLKELGADPAFFVMDEPLYHGVAVGCQMTVREVAADVASKVLGIRSVFPQALFGDVEPISFDSRDPWFQSDLWSTSLRDWLQTYQAAIGERLAFFRLDLWWDRWWQHHMAFLSSLLAEEEVPLQVIYNASGQDKNDATWTEDAMAHAREFETGRWPRPAAAVFSYWTRNPTRVLPESDPTTATGLIDSYIRWQETRR